MYGPGCARSAALLLPEGPAALRGRRFFVIISFGYMGGNGEKDPTKRIGVKVKAAAHQEYNDREVLKETMDHLVLGHDIFGRNAHFERCEIDDSYPQYLREHISAYSHLVMPKVTAFSKLVHYIDITAGRFCRKAYHKILRTIKNRK